jgi:tetratricopeptide (TPR) repeat protein
VRTVSILCIAALLSLAGAARADTPAEARIRASQERLARETAGAGRAAALVELAAAHTARARESADADHYQRALDALARAERIEPGHAGAARVEAWVRLGRHEFAQAEAIARAHLARHPDDHEAHGLLGDALMELGRLDDAAHAYQRMLDLRPGPGAYLRAAYWREVAGHPDSALALLERALAATSARETEQRAWTLVQMAPLEERLGRPGAARARLDAALAVFPGYHYALAALARHHLAHGRPELALPLAHATLVAAPHPEHWLLLADALRGTAREAEAHAAEDRFEREALANASRPDNENHFLVDFYLDRRPDPPRALEIARREAARRADPATLARLDRALARNGLPAPDRR